MDVLLVGFMIRLVVLIAHGDGRRRHAYKTIVQTSEEVAAAASATVTVSVVDSSGVGSGRQEGSEGGATRVGGCAVSRRNGAFRGLFRDDCFVIVIVVRIAAAILRRRYRGSDRGCGVLGRSKEVQRRWHRQVGVGVDHIVQTGVRGGGLRRCP